MANFFLKIICRIRGMGIYRYLPMYWWFHKYKFGITNTKFDISWCVFRESFIQDQYDIRRFLDIIRQADTLFFFDIGRNHGFVFYYTMYHIMRSGFNTSVVNYVGIDPSPLKFVYFNYFNFLRKKNVKINYFLVDKAVIYGNENHVKLKYGEKNFGNFNINDSNYAQKLAHLQNRFSYVEITVETIGLKEIKEIVVSHMASDAIVIKIDCKNQTNRLFLEMLDSLSDFKKPYLIASEKDFSGDRDVSKYRKIGVNVLATSNVFTVYNQL